MCPDYLRKYDNVAIFWCVFEIRDIFSIIYVLSLCTHFCHNIFKHIKVSTFKTEYKNDTLVEVSALHSRYK